MRMIKQEYKIDKPIGLPTALRLLANGEVIWCDEYRCFIWIEDDEIQHNSQYMIAVRLDVLNGCYSTVKREWYHNIPIDGVVCKAWNYDINIASYVLVTSYEYDTDPHFPFTANEARYMNAIPLNAVQQCAYHTLNRIGR